MTNQSNPDPCERTIIRTIAGFLIGYVGIYLFAVLVGLFCAGAMLLVGSILAAVR